MVEIDRKRGRGRAQKTTAAKLKKGCVYVCGRKKKGGGGGGRTI